MDRTAPMVIFTTLHGDTGWLVAALFVWGFELDWSIFSWIHSRYRVDLNILKIQSNKLLLFGGKFAKSRNAH